MSLKQFELFRLMPSSGVTVNSVASGGGNIKTGAYQFAHRLINDSNGRSSKFSLFTHPVMISFSETNGDKSGPVNVITDKSVSVSFTATNEEVELFTSYQMAVIESNTATGQSSMVSLSDFIALTPGENSYKFDNNNAYDRIGIEEVSIDDASISTFKTIAFKNNKLVGGNVRYKDLSFDMGIPSVLNGSIITRKIPTSGNTDKAVSESKGYFLDEVYRFYVSFWDEYGDFSFPYPLNMSAVTGNQAVSFDGFKDMKFPKRDKFNKIIETILPGAEGEHLVTINRGLSLTISNIPSWSKGFVILRAERKKGVLFQSPLIPTSIVQSPDALGEYPGESTAAPNPLGTIVPKNFAFSLNKAIVRKQGTGSSFVDWSANYSDFEFCKKIHVAFPPEIIFNNSGVPYLDFIKNEKISLEAIDYCFLGGGAGKLFSRNKSLTNTDLLHSNDGSRSSAGASVAQTAKYYASDRLSLAEFHGQISSTDREIVDEVKSFTVVPSGVSSMPIVGLGADAPTSDFGNYGDLKIFPEGAFNGTPPSNSPMVVITTNGERPDLSYYGVDGSKAGYNTSNIVRGANDANALISIVAGSIRDLQGQSSNPGYDAANSFLEIVNFRSALGDDRYGSPFSQNEIVSTGSFHSYLSAPISLSVEVFGGDCFISPFTFKVQDSHYAVVNSNKWGDTGEGWGKSFKDADEAEVRRPFPYKSHSYSIGLYLESEVNSLYSEEFTNKGLQDIYSQITPSVSAWAGSSSKGAFYSYQGRIYRGIASDSSGNLPSDRVGYIYEDIGRAINGTFYQIKYPLDLFYIPKSFTENKIPMVYLYNPEYSIQDQSKPFPFVYSKEKVNRTNFSARLIYSDTGILQTNVEGFNRFRVGNFFDLEESNGSITKIIDHKGNLYGIQQNSFCYIPFESSLIETADGVSLSVQSSQIVGRPQYIERHGSNYIRTVVSTPSGLMFADYDNSKIVLFNQSVSYLNDIGVSKYIQDFSTSLRGLKISDRASQFYYDYSVDDVVFKMGQEALILGPSGSVKTILSPPVESGTVRWDYGMYDRSEHFLIGRGGPAGQDYLFTKINDPEALNKTMFGTEFSSGMSFVVNNEPYYTKMFYLVKFIATGSNECSIETFTNGQSNNSYSSMTMADRWSGFVLNFIRNADDKRRLRGEYAVVSTDVTGEIATALTKVQATYRMI